MSRTSWTIKASKLCNLRCAYCYEWPHLADATRVSLAEWGSLLAQIRWYHALQSGRSDSGHLSSIIWHGGEPLALPIAYWREVADLQREILRDEAGIPLNYRTAVQTNLYAVPEAWLALFEQEQMLVGVSYDGVPGLRLSAHGSASEPRVLQNMGLLKRRNIPFGVAVVLTAQNRHALPKIYQQLKDTGAAYVKIIPLLKATHFTDSAPFAINRSQTLEALGALYLAWSQDPAPIPVFPFTDCVRTVHLRRLNFTSDQFDRRIDGERRLIVDINGGLYSQPGQYGPEHRLGNLLRHSLAEILDSQGYQRTLAQDDQARSNLCIRCRYVSFCDTQSALADSSHRTDSPFDRCRIKAPLCDFIEKHLNGSAIVEMLALENVV